MKNSVLRFIFMVMLVLFSHCPAVAAPTKMLQSSCLLDEATSRSVSMFKLATNIISEQADYADGYDAVYYFMDQKTEVGYAEKSGKGALIFAGKIYPLESAKVISASPTVPSEFSPALASWSRMKDTSGAYLCVNFNFDGIGRSGSFQNFKGGYLLGIGGGKHVLYYMEGDVSAIRQASSHK